MVSCNGNCYTSVNDILNEIRGALKIYSDQLTIRASKRARLTKSQSGEGAVDALQIAMEIALMSYLYDDESERKTQDTSEKFPCLVIIMRTSEKMSPVVFGNLLESLGGLTSVRLFFVMDHSSSCPLPAASHSGHRCLLDIDIEDMPSTTEFYDSMLMSLLSTSILPVALPPSVLTSMQRAFDDNDCCVSSLVARICVYVTCHFRYRQAILCVTAEQKLMTEVIVNVMYDYWSTCN